MDFFSSKNQESTQFMKTHSSIKLILFYHRIPNFLSHRLNLNK